MYVPQCGNGSSIFTKPQFHNINIHRPFAFSTSFCYTFPNSGIRFEHFLYDAVTAKRCLLPNALALSSERHP